LLTRGPLRSTLFPYTTLFRSLWRRAIEAAEPAVDWVIKQYAARENLATAEGKRKFSTAAVTTVKGLSDPVEQDHYLQLVATMTRSEEHTSELQSRENLVCRLL